MGQLLIMAEAEAGTKGRVLYRSSDEQSSD